MKDGKYIQTLVSLETKYSKKTDKHYFLFNLEMENIKSPLWFEKESCKKITDVIFSKLNITLPLEDHHFEELKNKKIQTEVKTVEKNGKSYINTYILGYAEQDDVSQIDTDEVF